MISVNALSFVLFYILTHTTCITQGGNATLYKILNKALDDAVDKYAPRQYRSKRKLRHFNDCSCSALFLNVSLFQDWLFIYYIKNGT